MSKDMLATILEIENKSYPVSWTAQLFNDCLNKNYLCKVMLLDKEIIGYSVVQVILDEYHILNLCVAPEFQGKGYGRHQLNNILAVAQSENMNRILLEVRSSNRVARKLYTGSGFTIIGKRKNYYPLAEKVREDAHVMELALG